MERKDGNRSIKHIKFGPARGPSKLMRRNFVVSFHIGVLRDDGSFSESSLVCPLRICMNRVEKGCGHRLMEWRDFERDFTGWPFKSQERRLAGRVPFMLHLKWKTSSYSQSGWPCSQLIIGFSLVTSIHSHYSGNVIRKRQKGRN